MKVCRGGLPAAAILDVCPDVTVLATSREPLQLRWEKRLVVAPLEVPDLHRLPPSEELRAIPAVALFIERAQAVLTLMIEGCPNKEIGQRLGISVNTAKFHVTSILNKLGVDSRAEAVNVAVRQSLL